MSIQGIDPERCNGCGICIESCPADVLYLGERRPPWAGGWVAQIRYPGDCHSCLLCKMDCPQDAIQVSAYLEVPQGWFPYPLPPSPSSPRAESR
ncbi:MAG: ferredoxin family protein [Chloroflexi bacterium]|nr:ferredoxin family protein [Chloroflexota bacterium]